MTDHTIGNDLGTRIEESSERLSQELREKGAELGEMAKRQIDEAQSRVEGAVEGVVDSYERARVRGLEVTDYVRHAVVERPLTSLGVGLGVGVGAGLLAGWLLSR